MFNTNKTKFAAALLAMAFVAPLPATAQDRTNFLIVSENADKDTVPGKHRIFTRVYDAIEDQLTTRGYGVYDEQDLALKIGEPGVRRNRGELLEMAKLYTSAPLDVLFIFQIYASAQPMKFNKNLLVPQIRVVGRFIEIRTGRAMGNFESEIFRTEPIPSPCDRNCLLEYFSGKAKVIARDVASAMATKMDSLIASGGSRRGSSVTTGGGTGGGTGTVTRRHDCGARPTAYTLVFDNFNSDEITQVEEYLVAFKCYDHHRPVGAGSATRHEYWYETNGDQARLNRNLRIMLDAMRIKAQINTSTRGFVINKIATF